MAQTTTPCPRCHQLMAAQVQQVFDLNQDPMDKERLLSGQMNIAICPSCGYQGALAVPIVYHDPEKSLFLTYFPSEAGLPITEQERIMGPLITQVVNKLPTEKRKGYLFQPQSMLNYDTLIEKILEGDGITKEMIRDQEKRLNLIRRLLTSKAESLPEIIKQESELCDQTFFALFSNVLQQVTQTGDRNALAALQKIQQVLLDETEYGRDLKVKAESARKAIEDLKNLGENLNQDTLLDLAIINPDETYLQTLAGLARNGMDYAFFTKLSEKINHAASEDEKRKLTEVRETLLKITVNIDATIEEEKKIRRQLLEEILKQSDMEGALIEMAQAIDEAFIDVAKEAQTLARKNGDFMRSGKIQNLIDTIEKISKPSGSLLFLEQLLTAPDEASMEIIINENKEMLTDELKQLIKSLTNEIGHYQEITPAMGEKLKTLAKVLGLV